MEQRGTCLERQRLFSKFADVETKMCRKAGLVLIPVITDIGEAQIES